MKKRMWRYALLYHLFFYLHLKQLKQNSIKLHLESLFRFLNSLDMVSGYPKELYLRRVSGRLDLFSHPNPVLQSKFHVITIWPSQDPMNLLLNVVILAIHQSLLDLYQATSDDDYYPTFYHSAPKGADWRVCKGF